MRGKVHCSEASNSRWAKLLVFAPKEERSKRTIIRHVAIAPWSRPPWKSLSETAHRFNPRHKPDAVQVRADAFRRRSNDPLECASRAPGPACQDGEQDEDGAVRRKKSGQMDSWLKGHVHCKQ